MSGHIGIIENVNAVGQLTMTIREDSGRREPFCTYSTECFTDASSDWGYKLSNF
jgi:hypothetical protein